MFSSILRELRTAAGLTQSELAKRLKVAKSTISMYESGKRMPRFEDLEAIADFFNVSLDRLSSNTSPDLIPASGLVKLYDGIPAGVPALLDEYVVDYIPTTLPHPEEYAAIIVHGESMINAGIPDGCTVMIKRQSCAENGQIVACRVNEDSVTLKRFSQHGDAVVLSPENPAFAPIVVPVRDFENGVAQILGVLKQVIINF